MASDAQKPQDGPPRTMLKAVLHRLEQIYSGSAVLFWPFTDVVMRFFIALFYFRSGLIKASDWDKAVLLATEEYPVSWMAPQTAATTGLAIELIAPVLLFLGLATRPAAIALGVLTVIAQVVYIPTTTNLMLIAMLIWYAIYGPAALSLDHLWVWRARANAGQAVATVLRFGRWTRQSVAPWLVLAMRVWLGFALLVLAGLFEPPIWLQTWIPITSFRGLPPWIAIGFAVLLITGTAASPVSYALAFIVAAFMIVGVHPDVTFYPVLLLGVYESRGAGPLSVDNAIDRWVRKKFNLASGQEEEALDDSDQWVSTLATSLRSSRVLAGKVRRKVRGRRPVSQDMDG